MAQEEDEKLHWPSLLGCSFLPQCMTPSVNPHKKWKNPFSGLVHAMKSSSLFSRTDNNHHRSNTEVVTGTLFGANTGQGHMHLVIHMDTKSPAFAVFELASTTDDVREAIADGRLQFLLTCVKNKKFSKTIWEEWMWNEHVNGLAVGTALHLIHGGADLDFLTAIEDVQHGTGVLPEYEPSGVRGEILYMRVQFEKTILSYDAQSLTIVKPENTECEAISIRFSRV